MSSHTNQWSRVLGSKIPQQEDIPPSGGTNSDTENSLWQSSGPCAAEKDRQHSTQQRELLPCKANGTYPNHTITDST